LFGGEGVGGELSFMKILGEEVAAAVIVAVLGDEHEERHE